jgi:hypothetical protein
MVKHPAPPFGENLRHGIFFNRAIILVRPPCVLFMVTSAGSLGRIECSVAQELKSSKLENKANMRGIVIILIVSISG